VVAAGNVESVRTHFIDLLTADQLAALAATSSVVLEHLDEIAAPRPLDVD